MMPRRFYGLLSIGLLVTAVSRYAPHYTGNFSLPGFFIGIGMGAIILLGLWWRTRGEARKGGDAQRAWRIIMGACFLGFLVLLPLMSGFGFR